MQREQFQIKHFLIWCSYEDYKWLNAAKLFLSIASYQNDEPLTSVLSVSTLNFSIKPVDTLDFFTINFYQLRVWKLFTISNILLTTQLLVKRFVFHHPQSNCWYTSFETRWKNYEKLQLELKCKKFFFLHKRN